MMEGEKKEAAQYSEKVKYRFSRTLALRSCQSKMNSESDKQRDLKLKPILSMRSEDEAGLNLKFWLTLLIMRQDRWS